MLNATFGKYLSAKDPHYYNGIPTPKCPLPESLIDKSTSCSPDLSEKFSYTALHNPHYVDPHYAHDNFIMRTLQTKCQTLQN